MKTRLKMPEEGTFAFQLLYQLWYIFEADYIDETVVLQFLDPHYY